MGRWEDSKRKGFSKAPDVTEEQDRVLLSSPEPWAADVCRTLAMPNVSLPADKLSNQNAVKLPLQ